ncbi:MAG: hypothetical protein EXS49_01140 [Candidatus Pacebacteria bacterium]|nr:hypothetical protein [Candidatus Paceibacterota bacterium]
MIFYFTALICLLIIFLEFKKRHLLLKFIRPIFYISLIGAFSYISYQIIDQYNNFDAGIISNTLNSEIGLKWFLSYVRFHFLNSHLVSLIFAIIILCLAEYFNKKKGEIFMEREEYHLSALGIFLVGYPGFIFYIPAVLISGIIGSLIFIKKGERLPLYHFWIPVALIIILIIEFWAKNQDFWKLFAF